MDPAFVVLKGSGAIALEVLQLAWRLEDQGLDLQLSAAGRLVLAVPTGVAPPPAADVAAMGKHEAALIALCRYVDREGWRTDAD